MKQLTNRQVAAVAGGALPLVAVVVITSPARQAAIATAMGFVGAAVEWLITEKNK